MNLIIAILIAQGINPIPVKIFNMFNNYTAVRVAYCESRFNPNAKNPNSTAKGLFQILDGTWKYYGCTGNPYNINDNIACAYKLYQKSGFRSWYASGRCWK